MSKSRKDLVDELNELRLNCDATESTPIDELTVKEIREEIFELKLIFDEGNN